MQDKASRSSMHVRLFLLGSAIFLYLQLFVLPATPRLAAGDQSIYLHSAARMFEGQIIFRDYDQFTFPGTDALYFVLFKLFGIRSWIPQAMLLIVGVASVWLSIKISKEITTGPVTALPGLLFLTLPYASYLDATHHLYSVFAALCGFAVIIRTRTPLLLAGAGALWGLATFFTQSMILGPFAVALFVLWEHRRGEESRKALLIKQACLLVSYLAAVSVLDAYFVWKAGPQRFFYYTVTFIAKYFSTFEVGSWRTYMLGWPSIRNWANWPDLPAWPLIHLAVPLIYILFFIRYAQRKKARPDEPWDRLMLINITGLCLFLTIASAPAWNRLYTVSLPALILLVWFLNSGSKFERLMLRMSWAVVVVLAIARPLVTQLRWHAILDLPSGRTAFFDPATYEKTRWLMERTHPSEYFFGDQSVCFDLRLENPSRVAYVTPYAFTRPEEIADVVQGLEKNKVRFVSWYPGLDAPVNPSGNNLGPLRRYLESNYHIAKRFSNGHLIWERNS